MVWMTLIKASLKGKRLSGKICFFCFFLEEGWRWSLSWSASPFFAFSLLFSSLLKLSCQDIQALHFDGLAVLFWELFIWALHCFFFFVLFCFCGRDRNERKDEKRARGKGKQCWAQQQLETAELIWWMQEKYYLLQWWWLSVESTKHYYVHIILFHTIWKKKKNNMMETIQLYEMCVPLHFFPLFFACCRNSRLWVVLVAKNTLQWIREKKTLYWQGRNVAMQELRINCRWVHANAQWAGKQPWEVTVTDQSGNII